MLFAMLFGMLVVADQIDMRDPDQRIVMNNAELRRLCATGGHVFACTLFPEERLECHCSQRGALWFPELTAHLAPVMILSRPSDAQHEWLHLHDLRFDLEAYV